MTNTNHKLQQQVRQEAAKVKERAPAEGNEEAVEDAFAAEINTRVVRCFLCDCVVCCLFVLCDSIDRPFP